MTAPTSQNTDSAVKPALVYGSKKPVGALLAVLVGYIVLVGLTWLGIDSFSERRALADAQYRAENWSDRVVRKFVFVEQTFQSGEMQIYDKNVFADIPQDKEVYRYTLTKSDGTVFWSSRRSLIGKKIDLTDMALAEAKAKKVSRLITIPHNQTDGLVYNAGLAAYDEGVSHSHHDGATAHGSEVNMQQVGVVTMPVFYHKQFVGSVVVHTNLTSTIIWLAETARNVAMVISAILAVIFAGIALMIWNFAKTRARQLEKLETSQQEAVEMAEQMKTLNEDIISLNIDLKNNVKTLRETRDEVIRKGKMAQLGQLTATVAHDIRNPLGTVRTSAFLLRRKFAPENPAMIKPLDRIEKGVARCDGIISELLDFARTKNLNLKEQNLDQWLAELLREQLAELPEQVAIEFHPGLDDKAFYFDSDILTRAIINFLTNASEAMVGKGSEVPLEPTENPKISVVTLLSERGVEISISDNGPGISKEIKAKIFDPLFTTKSFGVGLGLPAVEKIFEQHGGGLEVHSIEGDGATFTGWISGEMSDGVGQECEAA